VDTDMLRDGGGIGIGVGERVEDMVGVEEIGGEVLEKSEKGEGGEMVENYSEVPQVEKRENVEVQLEVSEEIDVLVKEIKVDEGVGVRVEVVVEVSEEVGVCEEGGVREEVGVCEMKVDKGVDNATQILPNKDISTENLSFDHKTLMYSQKICTEVYTVWSGAWDGSIVIWV